MGPPNKEHFPHPKIYLVHIFSFIFNIMMILHEWIGCQKWLHGSNLVVLLGFRHQILEFNLLLDTLQTSELSSYPGWNLISHSGIETLGWEMEPKASPTFMIWFDLVWFMRRRTTPTLYHGHVVGLRRIMFQQQEPGD